MYRQLSSQIFSWKRYLHLEELSPWRRLSKALCKSLWVCRLSTRTSWESCISLWCVTSVVSCKPGSGTSAMGSWDWRGSIHPDRTLSTPGIQLINACSSIQMFIMQHWLQWVWKIRFGKIWERERDWCCSCTWSRHWLRNIMYPLKNICSIEWYRCDNVLLAILPNPCFFLHAVSLQMLYK